MSFITKRLLLSKETTTPSGPPVSFNIGYCTSATCCMLAAPSDDCFSICDMTEVTATVYALANSTFTTGTILYKDSNLTQLFTGEGTRWAYPQVGVKNMSTGAVYDVSRTTGVIGAFRFNC